MFRNLGGNTSASGETPSLDLADAAVFHCGFTPGDESLDEFFVDMMHRHGVAADVCLRPVPWKALRAARRVHLLSRMPGKSIWFNRSLRMGEGKRLIVVHAANLTLAAAEHLALRFPDARVVFWFWNPAGRGTDPERALHAGIELWSFDEGDCERYRMRHNTQFAFSEIAQIGERILPDVDLGFYGTEKGRAAQLSNLAERVEVLGLSHRFQVVSAADARLDRYPLLMPAKPIGYAALLEETSRARIIVDIAQVGQSGMTLRTLESLYLGRKLLTNIDSVKGSPLYDPTRVFLLGEDSLEDLPAFICAAPKPPTEDVLRYYDFESWLQRFWQS